MKFTFCNILLAAIASAAIFNFLTVLAESRRVRSVDTCNYNKECIPFGRCKSMCEMVWDPLVRPRQRIKILRSRGCYEKSDGTLCVTCPRSEHLSIEYCDQNDDPKEMVHARSALKRIRKDYKNCGEEQGDDIALFLVGNQPVQSSRYPWNGVLKGESNDARDESTCGAVLITSRHAISAGHCVADRHDTYTITFSPFKFKLSECINSKDCKDGDCSSMVNSECISYNVIEVILHPKYESSATDLNFDIAVLTLDTEVVMNPVCLPDMINNIEFQDDLTLPAWNFDFDKEDFRFGTGKFRLAEAEMCTRRFTRALLNVDIKLCIGSSDNSKTCHGDSGTGIVRPCKRNGAMELVGITSFGIQDCETYDHSIFTGITGPILRWILNQLYLHKIRFED